MATFCSRWFCTSIFKFNIKNNLIAQYFFNVYQTGIFLKLRTNSSTWETYGHFLLLHCRGSYTSHQVYLSMFGCWRPLFDHHLTLRSYQFHLFWREEAKKRKKERRKYLRKYFHTTWQVVNSLKSTVVTLVQNKVHLVTNNCSEGWKKKVCISDFSPLMLSQQTIILSPGHFLGWSNLSIQWSLIDVFYMYLSRHSLKPHKLLASISPISLGKEYQKHVNYIPGKPPLLASSFLYKKK